MRAGRHVRLLIGGAAEDSSAGRQTGSQSRQAADRGLLLSKWRAATAARGHLCLQIGCFLLRGRRFRVRGCAGELAAQAVRFFEGRTVRRPISSQTGQLVLQRGFVRARLGQGSFQRAIGRITRLQRGVQ